ncbi:hypothetical protein LJC02_01935 [Breznakia sp. OttesenSCG-928-G09]|nr:hypothetical protein [Breznakia sp. OttesenSCG-928-G09]
MEELIKYKEELESKLKELDYSKEEEAMLKAEKIFNDARLARNQKKIPYDAMAKEIEEINQLLNRIKTIEMKISEKGATK